MKFGYTIIYVADVAETLAFFNLAFGLATRFIADGGDYGELETGGTVLAFASHALANSNAHGGYQFTDSQEKPLGIEIALVTDDVHAAHEKALAAGASEHAPVSQKPWGQVVSYVRCPAGILIELCSPVGQ
ncbi:VOC family protein [Ectopseudomonas mendocina]|uniref:VOC family protein n=1 Tax=Ectopseudomonas mendocina TaxID=300 RepID=A0ABZ2RGI8_ECTME